MATGNPVLYTDFSGGLNLEAGPYLLEDNQCQDCRNVYANRAGALTKRHGSTRVSEYENGSAVAQIESAHSLFATTGAATGFIGVGPAAPPNMVTNPSFETNTTGWTFASTSWSSVTQARTAHTFTGSDGSYSLRMAATKDANTTERYLDAQTILTGITVGRSYTGSALVETVAPGAYLYAFIEWRTAGDAYIGFSFGTFNAGVAGIQTISVTGTAPPTAAKAAFSLRIQSNVASDVVDAYFDNVDFRATDPYEDAIVKITTGGVATALTPGGWELNTPWEWVQGPLATDETPDQGPYYGMNGVDPPQYWDGSASATVDWVAGAGQGTVPAGTPYLIYAQDRMWATGDPDYPGRIWKTGVNGDSVPLPDPCNWDTDLIDDVDPDDGQNNTAIGTVGPYVLVFKERKAYVISDASSGIYRTLSSSIGCTSHRSVVETTQGTLFLSEDLGVCLTDGSEIRVVSDKIKPLLDTIASTQPLAYSKSVGTYYKDAYWLSIPYLDTENSVTLQYQLDTGAWWIHSFAAADFTILDSGGGARLYSAVPSVAGMDWVLNDSVYSDNGLPYESYWEGPYWTWGAPHLNKRVGQYRIDGIGYWEIDAGTTFNDERERLDYTIWETGSTTGGNFGDPGTDFGDEGTFGPSAVITEKRYFTPTDGWGRAWSLKITDDDANAGRMEIYSVAGFLRPRSD